MFCKEYISLSLFSVTQYNLYFNISTFNLYSIREWKQSELVWESPKSSTLPRFGFHSKKIIHCQWKIAGMGVGVVIHSCQYGSFYILAWFSGFSPFWLLLKSPWFPWTSSILSDCHPMSHILMSPNHWLRAMVGHEDLQVWFKSPVCLDSLCSLFPLPSSCTHSRIYLISQVHKTHLDIAALLKSRSKHKFLPF